MHLIITEPENIDIECHQKTEYDKGLDNSNRGRKKKEAK